MAPKNVVLQVKKLTESAKLPTRGSKQSAGHDLYSSERCVIEPSQRALIGTGISIKLPEGTYGRIAPRSGLASKHGIDVGAGVVDADYTGEIKVLLFNHSPTPFVVLPGDRIAQLIAEKIQDCDVEESHAAFDPSERGGGGFGSTGER
jgi:dUTP pyrophosphatase